MQPDNKTKNEDKTTARRTCQHPKTEIMKERSPPTIGRISVDTFIDVGKLLERWKLDF